MRVPYLDLAAQYEAIQGEIQAAISRVLEQRSYVLGPAVLAFEEAFAKFCNASDCVAVGSGTDALHLALLANGVGPGDEVITQANTFIATLEAIRYTGARIVLVDVREPGYTVDIRDIEPLITKRTKAVVPVHLYGQPADSVSLESLASKHNLALIHDASQAHGAAFCDKAIGSQSTACFSFYPGKNLGAYGEAGAVVTSDGALAGIMRKLRSHGSESKYVHDLVGYNYRMDGIQGAVLGVKLGYLDDWTENRRRVARLYDALLGADVKRPTVPCESKHVYHIYPVFVQERDRTIWKLAEKGIETNVHYPIPCHLQPGYLDLGYVRGSFPVSEMQSAEELSLPIYPEMTDDVASYVALSLKEVLSA